VYPLHGARSSGTRGVMAPWMRPQPHVLHCDRPQNAAGTKRVRRNSCCVSPFEGRKSRVEKASSETSASSVAGTLISIRRTKAPAARGMRSTATTRVSRAADTARRAASRSPRRSPMKMTFGGQAGSWRARLIALVFPCPVGLATRISPRGALSPDRRSRCSAMPIGSVSLEAALPC
jgi:hypothetical protein